MEKPVISVVMATFNEPPSIISQAIRSILDQTFGDFELLLLDDSTVPETIAAIDEFAGSDDRIRVVRSQQRMGLVRALNIGLGQVRGKYIARMDGDDIALPQRFEIQVAHLERNPDVHVLGGAMDIINETGEVISRRDYPTNGFRAKIFSLFRNPFAQPTVMMRRTIIDSGIRYDEDFRFAEDIELWLRLQKNGYHLANLPQTLLQFRVVGNLADKRTGDNFRYNFRARCKNFSWRSPLWSLASITVSKIYTLIPKFLVSKAYNLQK